MLSQRQQHALTHDTHSNGRPLTAHEREQLLEKFLPETPASPSPRSSNNPTPVRSRSPIRARSPARLRKITTMVRPQQRRPRVARVDRRKPIRSTFWHSVYVAVYWITHFFFSIYIRLRKVVRSVVHRSRAIFYHHNRSPELIRKDITNLAKMPQHLSVILELPKDDDKRSGLHRLLSDVGDLTAWCASVGIPLLSVYEKTGKLQLNLCR
jgi:dehydrodolichyl diphosphate syntase complex subunit NUS1